MGQPDIAAGAVSGLGLHAAVHQPSGWAACLHSYTVLEALTSSCSHIADLCRAMGTNQLSGTIPAAWSTLPLHSLSVTRNGGVCGGVPTGISGAVIGNDTQLNASCPWDDQGLDATRAPRYWMTVQLSLCCSPPADGSAWAACVRSWHPHALSASCAPNSCLPAAALLQSFKANLTAGAGALSSWLPGTNPCGAASRQWAGVLCDGGGAVTGLTLDGAGLRGPLGGGLAGLPSLQEISLARNQLTGAGRPGLTGPGRTVAHLRPRSAGRMHPMSARVAAP